jgi:hypothetical protein
VGVRWEFGGASGGSSGKRRSTSVVERVGVDSMARRSGWGDAGGAKRVGRSGEMWGYDSRRG